MKISLHKYLLLLADFFILALSFLLAFCIISNNIEICYVNISTYLGPILILSILVMVIMYQLHGLYHYQYIINALTQLRYITKTFFQLLLIFGAVAFFLKSTYPWDSRLAIGLGLLIGLGLSILVRVFLIPKVYLFFLKKSFFHKNALIFGAGEHGQAVAQALRQSPPQYFHVQGFIDDDPAKIGLTFAGITVLGSSDDLASLVSRYCINDIILAINSIRQGELQKLIERCKDVGVVTHVISDLYLEVMERLEPEEYGGFRTYRIVFRNPGIVRVTLKRLIDILVSGTVLVLLAPFFGLIAWLIKKDSPGPLFYCREVVGKDGKTFKAFKFRTMIAKNDDSQHLNFMNRFINGLEKKEFYLINEGRITKVGKFLRKYSIDELPQIWNVLKGEMSLVGPRFCSVEEYNFYKPWHKKRTAVKPGLTGLWQVRARSAVKYDDMVVLDLYYIENMSLWLDLEIILRTFPVVLFGKGSRIH